MSVVMIPVSLWSLIDQYLVTLMETCCARYVELQDTTIVVAEQFDPDSVPLPFVLIRGYERKMEEAQPEFGDGLYHLDGLLYPYEIIVTAALTTMAAAKDFAVNVSAAVTVELANDPTLGGLAADDGEHVQFFNYTDGEVFVRGASGQQPNGSYVASAVVRIDIVTER